MVNNQAEQELASARVLQPNLAEGLAVDYDSLFPGSAKPHREPCRCGFDGVGVAGGYCRWMGMINRLHGLERQFKELSAEQRRRARKNHSLAQDSDGV